MAKTTRARSAHTPVSNEPEERAPVGKAASRPPSEGKDPRTTKTTAQGTEQVEGFMPQGSLEAAAAPMTAPDTGKLRPIAEASFGPPPPLAETVHGPDNRIKINNTSVYPWRVHASLLITAADNSQWIGTGWFIGPHTLVTAGHVVYIKNSGVPGRDGWVKRIQVMPGRNGSTLPYGSVTSTSFRSVTGWTSSGDQNYDYGAIILPNNLGNTVGWFGFGVYSDADLKASVANISGYPGDKPSGTQWYDARRVDSVGPRTVYYDIDTFGGQSGSAAYRIINGGRFGVAVHAYGGATTNSGTRITSPVFNNMVAWKA
ncbi:MAG: endopeptidase [Zetaproteobacteria bacterium]|nr:MAG: endopeptidase [Zetaproteobacteria bacterium]